MNRPGSALIMVIACMALLCLTGANLWHSSWYAADIVYKKQGYEQRLQAAQGLVTYALAVCKEQASDWIAQNITTWNKNFEQWPCGDHRNYAGSVRIERNNTTLNVHAALIFEAKEVLVLECSVITAANNDLVVQGWQVHGA